MFVNFPTDFEMKKLSTPKNGVCFSDAELSKVCGHRVKNFMWDAFPHWDVLKQNGSLDEAALVERAEAIYDALDAHKFSPEWNKSCELATYYSAHSSSAFDMSAVRKKHNMKVCDVVRYWWSQLFPDAPIAEKDWQWGPRNISSVVFLRPPSDEVHTEFSNLFGVPLHVLKKDPTGALSSRFDQFHEVVHVGAQAVISCDPTAEDMERFAFFNDFHADFVGMQKSGENPAAYRYLITLGFGPMYWSGPVFEAIANRHEIPPYHDIRQATYVVERKLYRALAEADTSSLYKDDIVFDCPETHATWATSSRLLCGPLWPQSFHVLGELTQAGVFRDNNFAQHIAEKIYEAAKEVYEPYVMGQIGKRFINSLPLDKKFQIEDVRRNWAGTSLG